MQPVELHVVDRDEELKKQLVHNKVVVFEMEEITMSMTPEEESVEFGVNELVRGGVFEGDPEVPLTRQPTSARSRGVITVPPPGVAGKTS